VLVAIVLFVNLSGQVLARRAAETR